MALGVRHKQNILHLYQKDLTGCFSKAAALIQCSKNHPFIDEISGRPVRPHFLTIRNLVDNKELELFTMKAASGKADLGTMAKWFEKSVKV
jgi:hypothetical protein